MVKQRLRHSTYSRELMSPDRLSGMCASGIVALETPASRLVGWRRLQMGVCDRRECVLYCAAGTLALLSSETVLVAVAALIEVLPLAFCRCRLCHPLPAAD